MRKVTVELKVVLEIEIEDTDRTTELLSEMDYVFTLAKDAPGKIIESEIVDWEVKG